MGKSSAVSMGSVSVNSGAEALLDELRVRMVGGTYEVGS